MKKYLEYLKFMNSASGNSYSLTYAISDKKTIEELRPIPTSGSHSCFSSYLGGDYRVSSSEKRSPLDLRKYSSMKFDLNRSLVASHTKSDLDRLKQILPETEKLYSDYKIHLFELLGNYIDIIYEKQGGCVYIIPRREYYKAEMIAIMTKFRTIYEEWYIFAEIGAPLFKEVFPELTLEEIAFLLNIAVFRSGSGHGYFNSLGSYVGTCAEFMSFEDIMKKAGTGKFLSVSSEIISSIGYKLPSMSSPNPYSRSKTQHFEYLLQNKEYIFNKFLKKNGTEENIPSGSKQEHIQMA